MVKELCDDTHKPYAIHHYVLLCYTVHVLLSTTVLAYTAILGITDYSWLLASVVLHGILAI